MTVYRGTSDRRAPAPPAPWHRLLWAWVRGVPARLRVRRDEQTVLAGITDASKRFAMRLEAREAREFAGHEWALEALRTMRHNRVDYPREMEAWAVASTAHTGARPLPRPVPMASPNRLVLW